MKKLILPLFGSLLILYTTQGQQATATPRDPAVSNSTAKNVKIIAKDGKITLKGPVDSEQEKDTIASKAGEIAGKDKVDNQLEVKAEKK